MTIKQINHGAIQKICHLHNDIFHSIYLCHTLPNFTLSPPPLSFYVYNISRIIILCSYPRYTDKLLDMYFLLFAVILSVLHEKPRRKDKKKYIDEFERGTLLFGCLPSFLCLFFFFAFCLIPPFYLLRFQGKTTLLNH